MSRGTRAYQDEKWTARAGAGITRPEPGSRAAVALELLPREGLLIDLGCGDGALLTLASSSKVGVDLSLIGLARIAGDIPRVCADLDAKGLPFRSGCASMVTILDAMPYIESPVRLVAEIARVLAPGGHLILSCPNARQLPRLLRLAAGRPSLLSSEEALYDGGQRHHFTDRSIVRLMDAAGFACERILGLLPIPPGSRSRAWLAPIARRGLGRAFLAPGILVVGRKR
jgi:SAM-dependent methyltransferase